MVQVCVQRTSQSRTPMDQSDSGVTSAVDSPLVAFGLAKPSFQVQIVSRQFIDRAEKQPRQKAGHQFYQVLGERVLLLGKALLKFLKLTAAILW